MKLQYGNHLERVYERLRDSIVAGDLPPGTRLIEAELVEQLELSRTPIRSALQRLRQDGFVVSNGTGKKSKLTVAPLTRADADELFMLVGSVEGLGGQLAASLDAADRRSLARELKWINKELADVAASNGASKNRIFQLDERFHEAYVRAAAGPRLLAWHESIKPQAERYIRIYIEALVGDIGKSVDEHATTIAAIERGDASGARRAIERNWSNAAERLAAVIDEVGERGGWIRR